MSSQATAPGLRLVNLSELLPEWQWLREPFQAEIPDWHHVSTQNMPSRWPAGGTREMRWRATREAGRLFRAHPGPNMLVSHGPRPATYWGFFGGLQLAAHDVYSFNYTALPTGIGRRITARSFRHVTRFVVSSNWERELYADYFGIPIERIEFQPWGVQPHSLEIQETERPLAGTYICALGSQARDYATLVEAMRRLPDLHLVIVATPDSVRGIQMPPNVELLCNIPFARAMQFLRHSELMVLPMNDIEARCGHVTAVSALHMGIPTISSECRGLDDYLVDGQTAVVTPPGSPDLMAKAIENLVNDDARKQSIAERGQAFALAHCTQAAVVSRFRSSLVERGLLL